MKCDTTVVIPTTGARPLELARALESVASQTWAPAEVVIVVDGTARSAEAVAQHVKPDALCSVGCRIATTGVERGAGVSRARNVGAEQSSTSYVSFLDDDDCWKPGYLQAVFLGTPFDLALAAFEKHAASGIRPEKVPPERLTPEMFQVANPGLRGSNLTVRRTLFREVGGFDETLPAFNDLDFGMRVAARPNLVYRRVTEPLVEFHCHAGPRLSTAGSVANRSGLARFLEKHGPGMPHWREAAFRARALELWNQDPWNMDVLRARWEHAQRTGTVVRDFPAVLHAAETRLLEAAWSFDTTAATEWQLFIDEACAVFEHAPDRPRVPHLHMALTTTDTAGSVRGFLESLAKELDHSGWGGDQLATYRNVNVLIIDNGCSTSVREAHQAALCGWDDPRIQVRHYVPAGTALSIGQSRARLVRLCGDLGWHPAPEAPLWLLDEDLRWSSLLPDPARGWRITRVGSVLHRAEALVAGTTADGIIGGNTGAAPVPALSILGPQVADILEDLARGSTVGEATMAWSTPARLSQIRTHRDYYYALSRRELLNLADTPTPVNAPGRITHPWWQLSEDDRAPPASNGPTGLLDDVVARLVFGLPVTRPMPHRLSEGVASAWGTPERAVVSGGNVLLVGRRAMDARRFLQVEWGALRSRRADTCWSLQSQAEGAVLVEHNLPLLHVREAPAQSVAERDAARAGELLVQDALGVGLYETLQARGWPDGTSEWLGEVAQRVGTRLTRSEAMLLAVVNLLVESRQANESARATRDHLAQALLPLLYAAVDRLRLAPSVHDLKLCVPESIGPLLEPNAGGMPHGS